MQWFISPDRPCKVLCRATLRFWLPLPPCCCSESSWPPAPAQALPGSSQDHFLLACVLTGDGWCCPGWIHPRNRDLCDLSSLCFFDLGLADKAVFLESFLPLLRVLTGGRGNVDGLQKFQRSSKTCSGPLPSGSGCYQVGPLFWFSQTCRTTPALTRHWPKYLVWEGMLGELSPLLCGLSLSVSPSLTLSVLPSSPPPLSLPRDPVIARIVL